MGGTVRVRNNGVKSVGRRGRVNSGLETPTIAQGDGMPGPLDGVKVVEFREIVAAPFAGMLLSDMGAEVVKVEPPWGDPWRTAYPFSETEGRPFLN